MTAVEEAKELLRGLEVPYPFTQVESGTGDAYNLPGAVVGGIRAKDGRAIMVPIAESASLIAAFPGVMKFMSKAPEVMAKLVEEAEKPLNAPEAAKMA